MPLSATLSWRTIPACQKWYTSPVISTFLQCFPATTPDAPTNTWNSAMPTWHMGDEHNITQAVEACHFRRLKAFSMCSCIVIIIVIFIVMLTMITTMTTTTTTTMLMIIILHNKMILKHGQSLQMATIKPVYNNHYNQYEKRSLTRGCCQIQVAFNTRSTIKSNLCWWWPVVGPHLPTWTIFATS